MKILFVPGILDRPRLLRGWERDLPKAFPKDEVKVFRRFYFCAMLRTIRKLIAEVKAEIESTQEDTIIFAHSFGGLVSKKALEGITRPNIKLITMGTPHESSWVTHIGFCEWAKRKLSVPKTCPYLTQTYGGTYDHIVFNSISTLPPIPHEKISTYHLGFLFNEKIRHKIIHQSSPRLLVC